METDLYYIAAMQAIEELENLIERQAFGERREISEETIGLVKMMKEKWGSVVCRFRVGEYLELITAISDGFTAFGSWNVIFPPPTIVQIVERKPGDYLKYGVKVIKEKELPPHLQG